MQVSLNIPVRKRRENHLPLDRFTSLLSLNYSLFQVLSHSCWSKHQMFLSILSYSFSVPSRESCSASSLYAAMSKCCSFRRPSHFKRKMPECFKNKSYLNLHSLPSAGWGGVGRVGWRTQLFFMALSWKWAMQSLFQSKLRQLGNGSEN